MTAVTVGIPVLGRPARVAPLLESLLGSLAAVPLRPLFLVSPGDDAELDAVLATGVEHIVVPWEPGLADFARKHNLGFRATQDEWYFVGADDLRFHPGWADRALDVAAETDACVVGTNDLGNAEVRAGRHATHMLVNRDYLACEPVVGRPGEVLCELYGHECCDNELVETAMARGTYAHADDSIVEHLHPFWGKGDEDATYRKGRETSGADRNLLQSRRPLWRRLR